MNRFVLSFAIFCFCSTFLFAQQIHYSVDEAHSHLKFTGTLGGMMEVEGKFASLWGDLFFDPENPEALSVTVVIDPSSLDSDNEWRDRHLNNPEFLDTDKHDMIVFKSTAVGAADQSMHGMLLLKGKERPITISYHKDFGPGDDPWQNRRVTFSGSFEFSRSEYELGPTEGFWGNSIADAAKVSFTISATRQNMDRMSIFKREPVASIWTKLTEEGVKQGLEALDDWSANPPDEKSTLKPDYVDLIAKRLHQYGHQEIALAVLQKNQSLFPDTDWVYTNLAVGLLETGQHNTAKDLAAKALSLNNKNALAIELLK